MPKEELQRELAPVIAALKRMAVFETKMAELYSACAARWEEDSRFWLDIWKDEIKHAQYVSKIIDIITAKPDRFSKGRFLEAREVDTIITIVKDRVEKVKSGEIPKEDLFRAALDLEEGYLESNYSNIVTTDDMEYKTLAESILQDTAAHQDKFAEKNKAMM